ncbi:MAG: LysM peptidoglycan-binding domain-containing protein [Chloroflexi bacterium]|nr:LysM peptidoglycan-binding domain-containing protein [Chloroflexota bacterium]
MKKAFSLLGCALLAALALAWVGQPPAALAGYQLTPFPTPTPGDDGRILYVVQPGDTCWRISAVAGVSLDQLRALNNIGADCVLQEGQTILLGLAGPAQATQAPVETAPAAGFTPSPTPGQNSGTLCVLLYNDLNGDGIRQEEELPISGGEASVTERAALYSGTQNTTVLLPDGTESFPCFADIPVGNYNITVAIPDGYNATTALNVGIELLPGDTTQLNFGAQLGSQAAAQILPPAEGGRSPVLGLLGIALLVVGIGVGVYSLRLGRGG